MSDKAYAKLDKWLQNLSNIGAAGWLRIKNTSSDHQEMYHVTARFVNGPAKDIDVFIDIF